MGKSGEGRKGEQKDWCYSVRGLLLMNLESKKVYVEDIKE